MTLAIAKQAARTAFNDNVLNCLSEAPAVAELKQDRCKELQKHILTEAATGDLFYFPGQCNSAQAVFTAYEYKPDEDFKNLLNAALSERFKQQISALPAEQVYGFVKVAMRGLNNLNIEITPSSSNAIFMAAVERGRELLTQSGSGHVGNRTIHWTMESLNTAGISEADKATAKDYLIAAMGIGDIRRYDQPKTPELPWPVDTTPKGPQIFRC